LGGTKIGIGEIIDLRVVMIDFSGTKA
jgi:hypothetical protein